MFTYHNSAIAEQHRLNLLREAERARLAAECRRPHAWRLRTGQTLIKLGEALTRADAPAHPRIA